MRAGEVVQIRVNPQDCMAVVDVLRSADVEMEEMSFSAAVSLALSALCQAARDAKIIPQRDGFEYRELMQPFEDKQRSGKKLAIASRLHLAGSEVKPPALREGRAQTVEMRRAEIRWKEMAFRQEQDPLNWSAADEAEFRRQIAIANGEPPPDMSGDSREPNG